MSPATTHLFSCCIFAICACSAADCARTCCSCEVCCSYAFSDTQADKISAAKGMAALAARTLVVMIISCGVCSPTVSGTGANCARALSSAPCIFDSRAELALTSVKPTAKCPAENNPKSGSCFHGDSEKNTKAQRAGWNLLFTHPVTRHTGQGRCPCRP